MLEHKYQRLQRISYRVEIAKGRLLTICKDAYDNVSLDSGKKQSFKDDEMKTTNSACFAARNASQE